MSVPNYGQINGPVEMNGDRHYKIYYGGDSNGNPGEWHVYYDGAKVFVAKPLTQVASDALGIPIPPAAPVAPPPAPIAAPASPPPAPTPAPAPASAAPVAASPPSEAGDPMAPGLAGLTGGTPAPQAASVSIPHPAAHTANTGGYPGTGG